VKKIFPSLLIAFIFAGCISKEVSPQEAPICGVQDPISNLPWLKQAIDLQQMHNTDSCSIKEYTYKGTLYYVLNNGAVPLKYHFITQQPQIYNCEGVDISDPWNTATYEDFFALAKVVRTIWKLDIPKSQLKTEVCNGTRNPEKNLIFLSKAIDSMNQYVWHGAIYEYEYEGNIIFFGIYTFTPNTRQYTLVALDCNGNKLSDEQSWSQSNFRKTAKNLGILFKK
jgi:hypothetical protein